MATSRKKPRMFPGKAPQRAFEEPRMPARFWFGVNVYAARTRASISRWRLAKTVGISTKALGDIETAAPGTSITLQVVEEISNALKISPGKLFGTSGRKVPKV
jgi:DNA-binding XRE family transcriptional regulator